MSRTLLWLGAVVVALAMTASHASAQGYPSKPITIVVPFPPGASTDGTARVLQPKLAEILGQPIIIENRGGAGGDVGSAAVAHAEPDGYTLLLTVNAPLVMNPFVHKNFPFNPMNDLVAVSNIGVTYLTLVVQASSPYKSLQDIIADAKKQPRKLTYGSAGIGSGHHLAGELLNKYAGIQITHVPFQGGGPAVQSLLGGHLTMTYGTLPAVLPQIAAGKLRLIAFAATKRVADYPDVPTIGDIVPQAKADAGTWVGILAPAKTPAAIVDKLHQAVEQALASEEIQQKLAGIGVAKVAETQESFDKTIKAEHAFWSKAIPDIGIQPQ